MTTHIFQPGDKVQTVEGERTVAWDDGHDSVWLHDQHNDGTAYQWSRSDLTPVPKVTVMWGNHHYSGATYWYDTRTDADRMTAARTHLLKWEQVDGQPPVITVIEDGEQ